MRRRGLLAGAALALAAGLAAPVAAQSNDEVAGATQWNFSTPGARSLALGGAFLGLADDATAAYANPAGLSQLPEQEVSLEGRSWTYTSTATDRGHLPDTGVTGIGVDTIDGLQTASRTDRAEALSFASYVHPGGREAGSWRPALALYRHQVADFAASLVTHGPFLGPRENPNRVAPARSHLDLEIESYGAAAAWRPWATLSFGLSFSYQRFALDSRTDRYARAERTGDPYVDSLTGGFFGPADFLPENLNSVQTQSGDDDGWAGSVGVLWRPTAQWSAGAVYRRGAEFAFTGTFIDGPQGDRPGEVDPRLGGEGTFHVPDAYGIGVAWRPLDTLLVAFDWDRVEYSDLSDDMLNLLAAARDEGNSFVYADADELHLGAEYQAVSWRVPVSFRAGAFYDPDHRLRYTGRNGLLRVRFRPGDDDLRLAGGLGIVVGRTQIDLAYEVADAVDTASLSAVTRF